MAITRVYNQALQSAGVGAQVVAVVEDKKLGLVAKLSKTDSSVTDEDVTKVLGLFARPWDWE